MPDPGRDHPHVVTHVSSCVDTSDDSPAYEVVARLSQSLTDEESKLAAALWRHPGNLGVSGPTPELRICADLAILRRVRADLAEDEAILAVNVALKWAAHLMAADSTVG